MIELISDEELNARLDESLVRVLTVQVNRMCLAVVMVYLMLLC